MDKGMKKVVNLVTNYMIVISKPGPPSIFRAAVRRRS
jgi:hypothetical protein